MHGVFKRKSNTHNKAVTAGSVFGALMANGHDGNICMFTNHKSESVNAGALCLYVGYVRMGGISAIVKTWLTCVWECVCACVRAARWGCVGACLRCGKGRCLDEGNHIVTFFSRWKSHLVIDPRSAAAISHLRSFIKRFKSVSLELNVE